MSFFNKLLNKIRGINQLNKPKQQFIFGSIISGTYSNYKHDPHPTILCLGCYNNNGDWFVHGLQLHNNFQNYIVTTVLNIKKSGIITNPKLFYNYLKLNNPQLVKECYRTYYLSMSDFKTVSPGFSNINENYCYPISDQRDNFLNILNTQKKSIPVINTEQLKNNVIRVINSVKIW